jgi:hypothetical protein
MLRQTLKATPDISKATFQPKQGFSQRRFSPSQDLPQGTMIVNRHFCDKKQDSAQRTFNT